MKHKISISIRDDTTLNTPYFNMLGVRDQIMD